MDITVKHASSTHALYRRTESSSVTDMDAATKKPALANASTVTLVRIVLWAAAQSGTIVFATTKESAGKREPLVAHCLHTIMPILLDIRVTLIWSTTHSIPHSTEATVSLTPRMRLWLPISGTACASHHTMDAAVKRRGARFQSTGSWSATATVTATQGWVSANASTCGMEKTVRSSAAQNSMAVCAI